MNWNDVSSFIQQPAYQVLLFVLLTPILIFVLRPKTSDKAWFIAFCVFVAFLVINAGLLWFDAHPWRYFFYSIGSSIVYILIIAIMMRGLLGILKLKSLEENAMAFLILIYQPFLLLLIMLVKWIVMKWF